MMNYANSTDVYKIWADMIAYDSSLMSQGEKYYCAFAGRRLNKQYVYSEQDIVDKFGANLKSVGRVPLALSGAMGDVMFLANFKTQDEMNEFYKEVTAQK
jgi:hypothetical protein